MTTLGRWALFVLLCAGCSSSSSPTPVPSAGDDAGGAGRDGGPISVGDGGDAGGSLLLCEAPAEPQKCTTLAAGTPSAIDCTTGSAPSMTGGKLNDGDYDLVSVKDFRGPSNCGLGPVAFHFQFCGTAFQEATHTARSAGSGGTGLADYNYAGTWQADGSALTLTFSCSQIASDVGQPSSMTYTTDGTTLQILSENKQQLFTLKRR